MVEYINFNFDIRLKKLNKTIIFKIKINIQLLLPFWALSFPNPGKDKTVGIEKIEATKATSKLDKRVCEWIKPGLIALIKIEIQ